MSILKYRYLTIEILILVSIFIGNINTGKAQFGDKILLERSKSQHTADSLYMLQQNSTRTKRSLASPYATNGIISAANAEATSPSISINSNYAEYTPTQLVQDVFVQGGACSSVSNVTYRGHGWNGAVWTTTWANNANRGLGYFNSEASVFPMTEGLILSTGNIRSSTGPNNGSNSVTSPSSGAPTGDADLQSLVNNIRNVSVLEFDFVPVGNRISFRYIFSSEEYANYVNSNYNDVFGFFISGPGIVGKKNIAVLPNNSGVVSINNVNDGNRTYANHNNPPGTNPSNSAYYVNIPGQWSGIYTPVANLSTELQNIHQSIQFNGRTVTLTATAEVEPCKTYHLKLAIGNVSDQNYQSGVFLEARSFDVGDNLVIHGNGIEGQEKNYEGCPFNFLRISRASADASSLVIPLTYQTSSTATNGVDIQTPDGQPLPTSVTIPANAAYVDVPYTLVDDGIADNGEFLDISVQCPCGGEATSKRLYIYDKVTDANFSVASVGTCNGSNNGRITISGTGGSDSYEASLNNGVTWQPTTQSFKNLAAGNYTLLVRNEGACQQFTRNVTIGTLTANQGSNITQCNNSAFTMAAAPLPNGITGTWSVVSGTATIQQPNSPTSTVTLVSGNSATLRWTLNNGDCTVSGDVTITNHPPIDIVATNGAEGNQNAGLRVQFRSGTFTAPAGGVTLYYTVNDGTATLGTDFTINNESNTTGSITIPAGQSGINIPFNTIDDTVIEGDENVTITLTSASSPFQLCGTNTATVTIVDNDNTTANKAITLTGTSAKEGSNITFTASLPAGVTSATALAITLTKGASSTAASADHGPLPASIVIPAGAASASVTVTTATDNIIEGDETIILQGSLTGYTVSPGTGTIQDATGDNASNKVLTITASPANAAEGTSVTYTLSLPDGITTEVPIAVELAKLPASTASGDDHGSIPPTLTIPAGASSATTSVLLLNDDLVEPNETLVVGISAPSGYTVSGSPATVTISDRTAVDPGTGKVLLTLSASASTVAEGASVALTAKLPGTATATEPVTISLSHPGAGTAGAGDYSLPASITIPTGQNSASVTLTATADAIIEGDETVTVAGTPADADKYSVGAPLTVTIKDVTGNNASNKAITLTGSSAKEGSNITFTASLPAGVTSATALAITLTKDASSTAASADHGPLPASIVIPAGAASASVTVTTATDNIIEGDETLILQGNLTGYTVSPATGTIQDVTGTIPANRIITVKGNTVKEGDDLTYTISLPSNITTESDFVFKPSKDVSSTAANSDHDALPANVTITAGSNSATFNVATLTDNIIEENETLVISGTATGFTTKLGTGTILDATRDNPGNKKISITGNETKEGNDLTYTVRWENDVISSTDITINLGKDDTSTASAEDHGAIPNSITIPAGLKSVTFNVPTAPDKIIENNETLVISGTLNDYSITSGWGTIIDATSNNPNNMRISITGDKVKEGENLTYTISLPEGITSTPSITINLSKSNLSTAANGDYGTIPATVTIDANSHSASFTVPTIVDNELENDETLVISGVVAPFEVTDGTGTIVDKTKESADKTTITLSGNSAKEGEPLTFYATLPTGVTSSNDITIQLHKNNSSTASQNDHSTLPESITIPAGESHISFNISTANDNIIEPSEILIISGLTNGFTIKDGTGTILDATGDIFNAKKITITGNSVKEGEPLQFKLSLPDGIVNYSDILVNISKKSSSTALDSDHGAISTTVKLPSNTNNVSFKVETITDKILENDETLTLGGETADFAVVEGTGVIKDATGDNPANRLITFVASKTMVDEGDILTFKAQLPEGITTQLPITISLEKLNTSTSDELDHSELPSTITIAENTNEASTSININQDNLIEKTETLVVKAQTLENYTLQGSPITVSIKNTTGVPEDGRIPLSFTLSKTLVKEGEASDLIISLPGNENVVASEDIVVAITHPNGGTATKGSDYNLAETIVIPKGQHSAKITISTKTDNIYEDTETVIVSATSPNEALFVLQNTPLTLKIADNTEGVNPNGGITIRLDVSPLTLQEGETAKVTASLPNGIISGKNIELSLSSSGLAINGSDYTLPPTITIPANSNSANVELTTLKDQLYEGDQDVKIAISADIHTIINSPQTVIIKDREDLTQDGNHLNVTISKKEVSEGNDATITISLPEGIKTEHPIPLSITQIGGNADSHDYSVQNGITIPVLGNSVSTEVKTNKDGLFEGLEKVSFSVTPDKNMNIVGSPLQLSIIDTDKLKLRVSINKGGIDCEDKVATATVIAENLAISGTPLRISMDLQGAAGLYVHSIAPEGLTFTSENPTATFTITSLLNEGNVANELLFIKGKQILQPTEVFIKEIESNEVKLLISNDYDGDGLSNIIEHHPIVPDTNGNGIPNEWDPYDPNADDDHDGILNKDEDTNGNGNPYDDDADNDGIPNFADPDSDNDGVTDSVEKFTERTFDDNKGDIRVHPALSLNEDGLGNDKLFIENIEKYPDNEVVIFNRQGIIVYKKTNYNNAEKAFRGYPNIGSSSRKVPVGTYFYSILVTKNGKPKRYGGFVEIRY